MKQDKKRGGRKAALPLIRKVPYVLPILYR